MTSAIRSTPFDLRTRVSSLHTDCDIFDIIECCLTRVLSKPSLSRMNALDDIPTSAVFLPNDEDVQLRNSRSKFRKVVKLFHKFQVKRKKDVSF